MIFWHTVQADTGKMEVVEAYRSIDEAIRDLALLAWEEPSRRWTDYLFDEETGEVVGVAIFGPEHELLVTCADGRTLRFTMPDSYRE